MRELTSVGAVRDEILAHLPGASCVGASAEAIDRLAALAAIVSGLALPPDHVEFLQLMGGGPPPLAFTYDADSSVDAVVELYGYCLEDGDAPPPGCVLVAAAGLHVPEVVIRVENGTVWSADDDQLVKSLAGSWLGLLARHTLRAVSEQCLRVELLADGVPGQDVLGPVREVLTALDWLSSSDAVSTYAVSPNRDMSVVVHQEPGQDGGVAVRGDDAGSVRPVERMLSEATGLRLQPWWRRLRWRG